MNKSLSNDDHVILTLIIDNIFPTLDTKCKVKWLRQVIKSYHNWNGFFVSEKWNDYNIVKNHNYITKLVTRKRSILNNGKEYVKNRVRNSPDLIYAKYKTGEIVVDISEEDRELIGNVIESNLQTLSAVYYSNDPNVRTHFFFVCGMMYKKINSRLSQSVTLYCFIDYIKTLI